MKTKKQMKQEIKNWILGQPNWEIKTGLILDKIGREYVHVLNLWDGGENYKMTIEEFYAEYNNKF